MRTRNIINVNPGYKRIITCSKCGEKLVGEYETGEHEPVKVDVSEKAIYFTKDGEHIYYTCSCGEKGIAEIEDKDMEWNFEVRVFCDFRF